MARNSTPEVDITEAITPVARVVDTYVRPADPAPSPLHEVAAALGRFNSKLASAVDDFTQGQAENQRLEGQAAFYRDHTEGAAEATRNGSIPAFANPNFTKGYEMAQGDAMGIKLDGQLGESYTRANVKASDDPNAFDNWFSGTIKATFGQEVKPGVLRGLMPHIHSMHAKYSAQFTKDRSEYVKGIARDRIVDLSATTLDTYVLDAKDKPEGYNLVDMTQTMSGIYQQAYKMGLERDQATSLITDAITAKAVVNRDARLLSLLDTVKDENGLALSSTEYGKNAKAKFGQTIQGLLHQEETQAWARQKRADEILKGKKQSEFLRNVMQDPKYQPSEEWLLEMDKVDPDFRRNIASWREATLKQFAEPEDEAAVLAAKADAYRRGERAVWDAFNKGIIKKPETLTSLMGAADNYSKAVKEGSSIVAHPMAKEAIQQIEAATKDHGPAAKALEQNGGLSPEGRVAVDWFTEEVTKWAVANPEKAKDPIEAGRAIQGFRETALRNIKPPEGAPQLSREERPQFIVPGTPGAKLPGGGTVPANQNTNTFQPQVDRQQPTPTPKTAPEILRDAPTPPKIGTGALPPKYEDAIRAKAKELGVEPQFLMDRMHQQMQRFRTPPGGAGGATSGAPAPGNDGQTVPSTQNPSMGPRSEADIPGVGKIDFAGLPPEALAYLETVGVTPEVMQQIQRFAQGQGPEPRPIVRTALTTPQEPTGGTPTDNTFDGKDTTGMSKLSQKYEVGGKGGSGTIAWDSTGGWSYGRKQFAAGGSTANGAAMRGFITNLKGQAPDLAEVLEKAGGAEAAKQGTAEFKAAWKQAAQDPRFAKVEDLTATQQLVEPARVGVYKEIGIDLGTKSQAVQEVLYSTAVQHGGRGAAVLWRNAVRNAGLDPKTATDAELINALYDERSKVEIYFRSSTPQVQKAVANRFRAERRDALAMLGSEGAKA